MTGKLLRIVQLSDIHLFADTHQELLKVNTEKSFQAVIQLLKNDPDIPQIILLSGDLTQDGSEESYSRLAEIIKFSPARVFFMLGNHDNQAAMSRIFPRNNIHSDKHILLPGWQLILLDSQKPHAVEGYLDKNQLDFMQKSLEQSKDRQAIIVFHHQPVPVGSRWLDKLGLTNADEFWKIIANYRQVNTVLFGHVHQEHEVIKNGVKYFSSPSTCIQFKKNSSNFSLDNLPPGFRWIDCYPEGKLITGISRVPHYIGEFDPQAKGY